MPYIDQAGGDPDVTVGLAEAHFTGGTEITTNAMIKSYSFVGSRVTMVYNAVAAAQEGFRETSGYSFPLTDVWAGFDPNVHEVDVFIGDLSFAANTGIAVSLVENAGATALGVGCYTSAGPRSYYQSTTVAPNGGGDAGLSRIVGRFTFGNFNAGDFTASCNIFNSNTSYPAPGRKHIVEQASTFDESLLECFVNVISLGVVAVDAEAAAEIFFTFRPILATPG